MDWDNMNSKVYISHKCDWYHKLSNKELFESIFKNINIIPSYGCDINKNPSGDREKRIKSEIVASRGFIAIIDKSWLKKPEPMMEEWHLWTIAHPNAAALGRAMGLVIDLPKEKVIGQWDKPLQLFSIWTKKGFHANRIQIFKFEASPIYWSIPEDADKIKKTCEVLSRYYEPHPEEVQFEAYFHIGIPVFGDNSWP